MPYRDSIVDIFAVRTNQDTLLAYESGDSCD